MCSSGSLIAAAPEIKMLLPAAFIRVRNDPAAEPDASGFHRQTGLRRNDAAKRLFRRFRRACRIMRKLIIAVPAAVPHQECAALPDQGMDMAGIRHLIVM